MNTHIVKQALKGVATVASAVLLIAMALVMMITFIYLNASHSSVAQNGRGWADIITNVTLIGGIFGVIALFCILITPKK